MVALRKTLGTAIFGSVWPLSGDRGCWRVTARVAFWGLSSYARFRACCGGEGGVETSQGYCSSVKTRSLSFPEKASSSMRLMTSLNLSPIRSHKAAPRLRHPTVRLTIGQLAMGTKLVEDANLCCWTAGHGCDTGGDCGRLSGRYGDEAATGFGPY
jgi:hypothetical protein